MRRVLSLILWSALTAAGVSRATFLVTTNDDANDRMSVRPADAASATGDATIARVIPVLVGGNSLVFTPNLVTAKPGDIIQFQFAARNHTVTQSTQSSPCTPGSGAAAGAAAGGGGAAAAAAADGAQGINSGFIPLDTTSGLVQTFDVPINDTNPIFLYCAQAKHCQQGMVMLINGNSEDLITYANTAVSAAANTPAQAIAGGARGNIPVGSALLPPPAPGGSSAAPAPTGGGGGKSSPPPTMTMTTTSAANTGGGGGTATVTRSRSQVTETEFTTVIVGPSGAAGNATGAARATGQALPTGGGAGTLNGASDARTQATGAAVSARELGSAMVAMWAAALGTALIASRW